MAVPFDLQLTEGTDPAFTSLHWMGYQLADGRALIDLTGIVLLDLKGAKNWVRKTLQVSLRGGKVEALLGLEPAVSGHH